MFGNKLKQNELSGSMAQIIQSSNQLTNHANIQQPHAVESPSSDDTGSENNDRANADDDELMKKKLFRQRKLCKRFTLLIVSITLLLDGMLNMVIIPIVPEYLKFIENNNKPDFFKYFISDLGNSTTVNHTANATLVGTKHHGDKFSYSQNDVLIGFLFATKPFIQLIVNPFSGALIDHIGYDLPMICGLSIQFISTIIFAYTNSFLLLFVARGLQGVGSALATTSGFAMIAHCFKEHEERTKSLGIVITSLALGSFMSVPYSGVLFEYAGKRVPFIVLAFLALFDAVLFLFNWQAKCSNPGLREDKIVEIKKRTPIWKLLIDPYIALCSIGIIMANVPLAFTEPTIAIWMKETMNATESQIGFIWLCGFLPHITGVFITVQLVKFYAKHQWIFFMLGLFLEAAACLWIPFITNYFVLILPICVITFGYGLIDSTVLPTVAYLVDTRHSSEYGTVYSIVDISYSVCYAFGPMIAGLILHYIGFKGLGIIISSIITLFIPFVIFLKRIYLSKHISECEKKLNIQ